MVEGVERAIKKACLEMLSRNTGLELEACELPSVEENRLILRCPKAIAHLHIALDRIQRQIRQLEDQGVDDGWVEHYEKRKRTFYNHVLPVENGKQRRFYLRKGDVSRKRSEIARGREVKELKAIANQIQESIAALNHVHGSGCFQPMNVERGGGRVEEGAIAL